METEIRFADDLPPLRRNGRDYRYVIMGDDELARTAQLEDRFFEDFLAERLAAGVVYGNGIFANFEWFACLQAADGAMLAIRPFWAVLGFPHGERIPVIADISLENKDRGRFRNLSAGDVVSVFMDDRLFSRVDVRQSSGPILGSRLYVDFSTLAYITAPNIERQLFGPHDSFFSDFCGD